jgi:hypothetical protein
VAQFSSFKTVPSDLAGLAVYIRTRHQEVLSSTSDQLMSAIAAGAGLIAAKENPELIKHGEFGEFCQKCGIGSQRLCQMYMQLARGRSIIEEKAKHVSFFGIREALNLLRSSNEKSSKRADRAKKISAPATLTSKILASVKTALSLAKADIGNEHEIANAMRAVNRLLGANGFDLHNLEITVAAKPKSGRRAA